MIMDSSAITIVVLLTLDRVAGFGPFTKYMYIHVLRTTSRMRHRNPFWGEVLRLSDYQPGLPRNIYRRRTDFEIFQVHSSARPNWTMQFNLCFPPPLSPTRHRTSVPMGWGRG